jgi:threonine dehydrogenase-like Zn-dependent dehydrogenase
MKALRIQDGETTVAEIDRPLRGDDALIRVVKSGICNTDIEIARGYAGFNGTIGHEFVGIVAEAPDSELIGKRVVGEINAGCGKCALCRAGDPRHCPDRTVLGIHGRDGAHAEFLTLPQINLLEVPDNVTDTEAVFVEPLAAAIGISEQVELNKDTKVAVIGDGKLGILCARGLSLLTKSLTLLGKHREKLDVGARYGNITTVLADDSHGYEGRFDVVIEASGSESGFDKALDLVRPRGKVVLKSTFHGHSRWDASRIVVNEVTVVGSRCGRFAAALELLSTGSIKVDDLVSDEMPLSNGVEALARASEKGILKILLTT